MSLGNTVSNHFLAAVGLEQQLNRAAQSYLEHFYWKILTSYRTEMQYERARLMRQNPLDYRAVREMDREMDDVSRRLRQMEQEDAFSG